MLSLNLPPSIVVEGGMLYAYILSNSTCVLDKMHNQQN